ncbi:TrbC/VirB2 family protein [Eubacterium sp. 1001713B170207_170306_E7]|uniref:TrbC/VirB2 family protein n=1 Tax=Eubacterium sp. 1001713B170207_170306_E7 TaxID=2787097 RepID=UPI0018998946|nr:TrbC/VirB2 family protein [Eubacterium sp. 1001713B170207_170306_E7]
MKKKANTEPELVRRGRIRKKKRRIFYVLAVVLCCFSTTALAADDPIAVVNNLSNFIFGLVRAIGMILIGYGIVQIGLSLKSHDPSQRANGIMTVAGGIVVTFAKEILNTIAG